MEDIDFKRQSRIRETEIAYTQRAKSILTRYRAETSTSASDDYGLFVKWLISLKSNWQKPTWHQYKSALMYYFEVQGLHKFKVELQKIPATGCAPKPKSQSKMIRNTSSQRQKSLPDKDMQKFVTYFELRWHYHWSKRALIFLQATRYTGLRPDEWVDLALIDAETHSLPGKGMVLKVTNAKATNGRSHGKYRHLFIEGYTEFQKSIIQQQMLFTQPALSPTLGLRGPNGVLEWQEYYDAIKGAVYRAGTKAWPNRRQHPTIYSGRHQFIADLKAAGYHRDKIAALVGHATDETATTHYGKGKSGESGFPLPLPLAEEVYRIRLIFEGYDGLQANLKPKLE